MGRRLSGTDPFDSLRSDQLPDFRHQVWLSPTHQGVHQVFEVDRRLGRRGQTSNLDPPSTPRSFIDLNLQITGFHYNDVELGPH
jgi:hypothetical protein